MASHTSAAANATANAKAGAPKQETVRQTVSRKTIDGYNVSEDRLVPAEKSGWDAYSVCGL